MATLWFHAIDSLGDTLISVDMYHQGGSDFGQGALPPGSSIGFSPQVSNVIYKVSRDDINQGKANPANLTNSIKNWPAFYVENGDTLPLAPFIDVNQDGKYTPELGDYPHILGDQSVFFVYHDMVNHAVSGSKPLGLQIQTEGYAFAANDKMNDYIFVRHKIISQNQNLSQFRVGVLSDYDLGNYADDYVGTDTSRNMTYVMNGDEEDDGIQGYGLNPPAFATVFLNQPLCGSCMSQNTVSGEFRFPQSASDYINQLYSLTATGDSMKVTTPSSAGLTNSRYHFTGNPVSSSGWTMETDNRFSPSDYRMLGITGQDSLLKGDTFDLWLLFAYARGNADGPKGSLAKLQTDVNDIFTRYFSKPQIPANCFAAKIGIVSPGVGVHHNINTPRSVVYPNPTKQTLQIQLSEPLETAEYELRDQRGALVMKGNIKLKNQLDVSQLASGIYTLNIYSDKLTQKETHRVVLMP